MKPKKKNIQTNTNVGATPKNVDPKNTLQFTKLTKILTWIGLGILLLTIFIIRNHFSEVPFERDEGDYAYLGNQLLKGKIPYVDFYEMKFPFLFYAYASIVAIFGYSLKGLHLGFLFVNLISIVLSYFFGKQIFKNNFAGLMTATAFAFLCLNPSLSGFTTQSEHLITFFTLCGLLLLYNGLDNTKLWSIALAGVSMALAFMIKPNAIFIGIAGGIVLILELFTTARDIKKIIINASAYTVAAASTVGFFLLLASMKGSWEATKFWVFDYANLYVGQISWEDGKKLFLNYWDYGFINFESIWYIALMGIPLLWFIEMPIKRKIGLWVFILGSMLTIVPGYRFFGHYWLMMMPLLAIAFAAFFESIITISQKYLAANNAISFIVGTVFLFIIVLHLRANNDYYFHMQPEQLVRNIYQKNPFNETYHVGEYIKSIAKPDDKLAIIGSEPELYLYTGLDAPTRHSYFTFMVQTDTLVLPQSIDWVKEFNNDIITKKPRFLVFYKHGISTSAVQKSAIDYLNKDFFKIISAYKIIGYAETKPDNTINYVFGEAEVNKTPPQQTDNLIYIYELK